MLGIGGRISRDFSDDRKLSTDNARSAKNTSPATPVQRLSMSIDLSVSKPVRRVGMISLGCPKNLVDSEIMLGQLQEESEVEITNDLDSADVVIVNTCGFIDAAKQESIDTILEVAERKGRGVQRLVMAWRMGMK